ncbi:MAG: D-alanine--D-alanine ligase, partial [Thermoplasmata archaeon]
LSLRAFAVLDIKDWVRFDWRMDADGEIYFLEANPLPGIDYDEEKDELSFYPMMFYAAGMDYSEMVNRVVEVALRRYGLR